MKIELTNQYSKYGCNFTGNLAVIEYSVETEKDPRWGEFASGIVYDYLDKAKSFMEYDPTRYSRFSSQAK